MKRNLITIIILICGILVVLTWPSAESSIDPLPPPVEPTVGPQLTSKEVDGVTYIWVTKDSRDLIELEGHNQAIEIDTLKTQNDQKDTGLKDLSAEIDTLTGGLVRCKEGSRHWTQQAEIWSERACDMSIYRRRQGEIESSGADLCRSDEFWKWVPREDPITGEQVGMD